MLSQRYLTRVDWYPLAEALGLQQTITTLIVHLPEFTEVGVRFCKPGKSQHCSAKRDTEDSGSDTLAISQPTVN